MAKLFRYRNLGIGGLMVAVLVLIGLLAPVLARQNPYAQDLAASFEPPSSIHLFGTDQYGRDVFSRVLYGGRLSLLEIVVSVGLSLLIGVPLGLMSGYFGGFLDQALTWVTDILYAFPGIVLAILVVAILGPSLFNTLLAISVFSVPLYMRLTRSLTLKIKQLDYVEAAIVLGAGPWRILFRHILPNATLPILVQSSFTAGDVVLTASGLSFLGLGAQPPAAEWGSMMSEGRNFLGVATHLSLFPGLVITFAVLGLNIFGDGLRDRLDPRFRSSRRH